MEEEPLAGDREAEEKENEKDRREKKWRREEQTKGGRLNA